MPSFTSSFNQDDISNNWLKTLVTGLLVAIVLLASWETYWRFKGFRPVIEDDIGIWAIKRHEVSKYRKHTLVLLGSSRMQLDIDPQIIEAETGYKTLMLAIDGSSPLPVLADLANDSSFTGLILCALTPQWLGDKVQGKSRSAKWVRKYYKRKWSDWIETRLSLLLQANFVFRYPGILPKKLWEKIKQGEYPSPPYAPMRTDRYRPADYSMTDITKLRTSRLKRQREIIGKAEPMSAEEFSHRISEINAIHHQIKENGGEIIFIRLPSCDGILRIENEIWPRRQYWDRFTLATTAPAIHFSDYPELSGFDCPDGSHLDKSDAILFTKFIAKYLLAYTKN